MAKYDQGGGCACGLYKECICEDNKRDETMKSEIDDFGFTTKSETDMMKDFKPPDPPEDNRALELYKAITPLLDNLSKSPENPYIHWPDRLEKIEKFRTKLNNILDGS